MGQSYYYFAAALPMIEFDRPPSMSVEEFIGECGRLLSENDFNLVRQVITDDQAEAAVKDNTARAWLQYQEEFRNEMVFFRAERARQDPLGHMRGARSRPADSRIREALESAARQSDLMAAEKILDHQLWKYLDELSAGHYFDLACILVYGLKLKILQRHKLFGSSQGRELFQQFKKHEIEIHQEKNRG